MTAIDSFLVHVVDDNASLRGSLARLLTASGYRVALYESAVQFLQRAADDAAGCILLDVNMPGLNGLHLQGQPGTDYGSLPIVFMTGQGDIPMSARAIKAGAEDFLAKPITRQKLLDAIQRALRRYNDVRSRQTSLHAMQERIGSLTLREREVFDLLIAGMLNKQIAHVLGNAERTVKVHRGRVMEKMQVRSVVELVRIATQLDVNMPGLNGLQAQGQPGAEDFQVKPLTRQKLLDAIQRALQRYDNVRSRQTSLHAMQERIGSLTLREREVFDLLIAGMLNKQIAHVLGNAERTVKIHRHRVMEKMQVRSVVELVLIATQLGLMKDVDHSG